MTIRKFSRVAMLTLLVVLLALPVLNYPLGRDQGEFATIGQALLDGKVPYVEIWNPKPPAVFYTYASVIALFGNSAATVRALDLILLAAISPALYALGCHLRGKTLGLLSIALFGAVYSHDTFWTLSQNDGLVLLPMTYATLAMYKAAQGRPYHFLWAFLAGLLAAVVLWFKYPFVTMVAALIVGYAILKVATIRRKAATWQAFFWDVGAFIVGGCIVGFGGIGYLYSVDAYDAWIESIEVTADYAQLGVEAEPFYQTDIWHAAVQTRWELWQPLVILSMMWLILSLSQLFSARARHIFSPDECYHVEFCPPLAR